MLHCFEDNFYAAERKKRETTATSGFNFKCIQNINNFIFRTQSRVYIIIQNNNRLTCPGFRYQVLVPMVRQACIFLFFFSVPENNRAAAEAHPCVFDVAESSCFCISSHLGRSYCASI